MKKIINVCLLVIIIGFVTYNINFDASIFNSGLILSSLQKTAIAQGESGGGGNRCYTTQTLIQETHNVNGCLISEVFQEECGPRYSSGNCWDGFFAVLYTVDNNCYVTNTEMVVTNDNNHFCGW